MIDPRVLNAARKRFANWGVRKEDQVLIVADTDTYPALLEACYLAAAEVADDPCVIVYPTRLEPFQNIPPQVEEAILASDFYVHIPARAWTYSASYVRVELEKKERGIREGRWGGQKGDMPHFLRLLPDETVQERTRKLKAIFNGASELHVTSDLGTDLRVRRGNVAERPTFAPDGQAAFATPEDGVNGVVYLVGAIVSTMPGPDGHQFLVEEPLRYVVEDGWVREIDESTGLGRFLARWFRQWKDPMVYNFAHINLGVDHRIQLHYLDNLAVHFNYGGILCGIGTQHTPVFGHDDVVQAKGHIELHLTGASLRVDGTVITENGEFTDASSIPRRS